MCATRAQCAAEIARVLKPGGKLVCCVPFLQPLHGFPHHYFNMTHQGLRTLFEGKLLIEEQFVSDSGLPIWSLSWMLRTWAEGLSGRARDQFLSTPVRDLMENPATLLDRALGAPTVAREELRARKHHNADGTQAERLTHDEPCRRGRDRRSEARPRNCCQRRRTRTASAGAPAVDVVYRAPRHAPRERQRSYYIDECHVSADCLRCKPDRRSAAGARAARRALWRHRAATTPTSSWRSAATA